MMKQLIDQFRGKSIHIVGVTGAEGSSILRFFIKHGFTNITAHDFLKEGSVEKSFKLWHKGTSPIIRENLYNQFCDDISNIIFYQRTDYLKDIINADLIFVPQSWRLYKENAKLQNAKSKKIPFYSLTRLYLDFAPAKIIGVTGTVGKGSVATIIIKILKQSGKSVYFAGNDTWMPQIADNLDEMKSSDYLVLEISHRQLLDGFNKSPDIVVITNIYPNHLDEVSWENYKNSKFSLLKNQTKDSFTVLNFDSEILRDVPKNLGKTVYYSEKNKLSNNINIQNIFSKIKNTKSDHLFINLLAGSTVASILDINNIQILSSLRKISSLPARIEKIGIIKEKTYINDIKSTTPWATIAALRFIPKPVILVCGGVTKGIPYKDFFKILEKEVLKIIFLPSELSNEGEKYLPKEKYKKVQTLFEALKIASNEKGKAATVLISPGAGFFYSDFIKGKQSIKKIFTSLLQEERG